MSRLTLILVFGFLSACAAQHPVEEDPELITDEREITPEMIRRMLNCSVDRTPVCVERTGKTHRCFCSDRDTLRQVLDPD